MKHGPDLDGLLEQAMRLARRQVEWGGVDLGDECVVGWTVTFLGVVSEAYAVRDVERLIDDFGAVGSPIPDDPRPVLRSMAGR